MLFVLAGGLGHLAFLGNDALNRVATTANRRAISRRLIPSSWSRKIALRLSGSIMEFFHAFGEGFRAAQDSGGQQMGLRVKGPALESCDPDFFP